MSIITVERRQDPKFFDDSKKRRGNGNGNVSIRRDKFSKVKVNDHKYFL